MCVVLAPLDIYPQLHPNQRGPHGTVRQGLFTDGGFPHMSVHPGPYPAVLPTSSQQMRKQVGSTQAGVESSKPVAGAALCWGPCII